MQVLLQTRALGKIPATDSSVIVATEPLWAAGFAALLLGENLPDEAKLGGALILLGCLANDKLPETLVAHYCGLRVMGVSLITNKSVIDAADSKVATHAEVLAATQGENQYKQKDHLHLHFQ